MKTIRLTILAAIGMSGVSAGNVGSAADEIKASEKAAAVGMLPHQKRGNEVDANERNPFAHRVEIAQATTEEDTNSEEAKIRAVLNGLIPTGITNGRNGLKAQVGGLILEMGRPVPQLIPNQTDRLRVTKVSAKSVEITWIDEEGAEEPRKHVIDLNSLKPTVETILPGSSEEGTRKHPIDPKKFLKTGAIANSVPPPSPVESDE